MASKIGHSCKFLTNCGGCETSKDLSLKEKSSTLLELLQENLPTKPTVTFHEPIKKYQYRTRALFRLHIDQKGLRIGFFEKGSRNLVSIDQCENSSQRINDWLKDFSRSNIKSSTKEKYRILVQEVTTEESDALIFLITPAQKNTLALQSITTAISSHPLCRWVGNLKQAEDAPFYTYEYNHDQLHCYTKPGCFQQANKQEARKLKALLSKKIEEKSPKKIIDLFSGAGYFSLNLSSPNREITGYDNHKSSIDAANHSANHADFKTQYFCLDLYGETENISKQITAEDTLILDPPRAGLKQLTDSILSKSPKHIYYISCDYRSLAEDLSKLSQRYKIESIDVFDFLPNTEHLEILTELTIK